MKVMMRFALLFLLTINCTNQNQKFEPNWESLSNYQIPEWYKDAKLGIFIHWGVYAVPATLTEWHPRRLYDKNNEDNAYPLKITLN